MSTFWLVIWGYVRFSIISLMGRLSCCCPRPPSVFFVPQVLQESRRIAHEAERYHATLARLQVCSRSYTEFLVWETTFFCEMLCSCSVVRFLGGGR